MATTTDGKRKTLWIRTLWQWVSHGDTAWGVLTMIFPSLGGIVGGVISWLAHVHPLLWFAAILGGIVGGLLIANELAARRATKRARTHFGLNVELFEQRPPMPWYRQKIESARAIWAAYLGGGAMDSSEILKSGNFKQLILLDPDSNVLKAIHKLESTHDISVLQDRIRRNTRNARNCDVRWCDDIAYSLLTIGNPPLHEGATPPNDMWVIIEAYVAGIEAEKRPSIYIEWAKNHDMAENALMAFIRLWKYAKPAPTEGNP